MGYQETAVPVKSLAEVAGIKRAIDGSEEVRTCEYLNFYCAAKARMPLYSGGWFGGPLSDVPKDAEPIIAEGELFAMIGGSRMYQRGIGEWLDCIAGIDERGYAKMFEAIPFEEAIKAEARDPASSRRAECKMRRHLNRAYNLLLDEKDRIVLPAEFAGETDDRLDAAADADRRAGAE